MTKKAEKGSQPKKRSAKTSRKRSPSKRGKSSAAAKKARPIKRYLLSTLFKLSLVMVVAIAGYGVYLDSQIKTKFEGERWELPAQIYARPLRLAAGAPVSHGELLQELELLGYRRVAKVVTPGEYAASEYAVQIYARPMRDGHRTDPARRLMVRYTGKRISVLEQNGQAVNQAYLEPYLIDRMQSGLGEDRVLVDLERVPQMLIEALLLVEDRDFYHHYGVSPVSIARALVANIKAGRTVQGGSTLTQQLVKNFFLTRERSIIRKLREAYMALIIDARYGKDEILEAYLNEIYLGQNYATAVHGFGLASQFYFGRPLAELNVAQLASLVAMIKGPSYYDPWRHPERLLERRDLVLRLLLEHDFLETEEYKLAVNQPTKVLPRSEAAMAKKPALTTLLRRELSQLAPQLVAKNGLKIYTTLDPLAQKAAEKAAVATLPTLEKRHNISKLQTAIVVTDAATGGVRALVGDRRPGYAGFNRAMDARRPIGSLIKPVVYLAALTDSKKYSLATVLADRPVSMVNQQGKRWQPQNYDHKFRGNVSLMDALVMSLNVPTVNLGMSLGLDKVSLQMENLGVESPQRFYPSSLLGSVSMTPLEVAQLYSSLSAEGSYQPLHLIRSVLSSDDEVLAELSPGRIQRADRKATYLLNYALHDVTVRGTAKSLGKRFPSYALAGKTGTSNDNRDSWYAGFDARDVVTVWIGRDDNAVIGLTGSSGALNLYADYLKRRSAVSLEMTPPAGVQLTYFDTASGTAVGEHCEDVTQVPAITSALPSNRGCQPNKEKSWWTRMFGR
ncbi:penicillin-binding protein 1B [Corallincola holothuriorum]|uniref:Penicillin-binding protein 1B n=1 Tax=Corallincola holothuriorum TaxID=2282215 RepID=A0A368NP07_9GAMM|nr:penicillin-binding protein 1B [Corallincola holothuriorum]RCU51613.1 penicillin-binding protein 1B [Corallincola holothuriorum]